MGYLQVLVCEGTKVRKKKSTDIDGGIKSGIGTEIRLEDAETILEMKYSRDRSCISKLQYNILELCLLYWHTCIHVSKQSIHV